MTRQRMTVGLAKDLGDATQQLEQFQAEAQAAAESLTAVGSKAGGMLQQVATTMVKTLQKAAADAAAAQGDIVDEELKKTTAQIQSVLAPLDSSLDHTFMGMIERTQTLRKGIADLGRSFLSEEISMNEKRLSHWVATEAAKTLASLSGNTTRQAADTASAATGKATQDQAATASIFTSAKQAAAGAYAAVSPIPIVGPILAPIAAATAFGAVMAFNVTSAEGGWDRVPADGMMAELHKDEMVLPAGLAGAMRDRITGGGNRYGDVNNHFHLGAGLGDVRSQILATIPHIARAVGDHWNKNPSARPKY